MIVVVSTLLAFAFLASSLRQSKTTVRNNVESSVMMGGHSVAALLKEDIALNYQKYSDLSDPTWSSCRSAVTPSEFLSVLQVPGACRNVPFVFTHFRTGDVAAVTTVTLSELTSRTLLPNIGNFSAQQTILITGFNPDAQRNQLIANLNVDGGSKAIHKTIRMVIDVARTISSPIGSSTAKICRSVAGAVCEPEGESITLSYLDSNGRVISLSYTESVGEINPVDTLRSPAALSVAVKNIGPSSTGTDYSAKSFCPAGPGSPALSYVSDTASGPGGDYYLTFDGRLLRANGSGAWASPEPEYVSIGYTGSIWLVLRSDGAVLKSPNIEDPSSFKAVKGLVIPAAVKITTGPGPVPCT